MLNKPAPFTPRRQKAVRNNLAADCTSQSCSQPEAWLMPKVRRPQGYAALQPAAGKSHGKCVTPGSALPNEPELQKSAAGHTQMLGRAAGNREELCFCLFFGFAVAGERF